MIENFSRKAILAKLNEVSSIKLSKNQLPNDYQFGLGTNSYIVKLYPGVDCVVRIEIKEKK